MDERARLEAIEPIAPELNLIGAGGLATLKSLSHGGLIAGGHAFEKHVLMQGEFRGLGIRTREQFATHIDSVINNPTAFRSLGSGRSAYWHADSGTVVIKNPRAIDGGTAFQPSRGQQYFENLR